MPSTNRKPRSRLTFTGTVLVADEATIDGGPRRRARTMNQVDWTVPKKKSVRVMLVDAADPSPTPLAWCKVDDDGHFTMTVRRHALLDNDDAELEFAVRVQGDRQTLAQTARVGVGIPTRSSIELVVEPEELSSSTVAPVTRRIFGVARRLDGSALLPDEGATIEVRVAALVAGADAVVVGTPAALGADGSYDLEIPLNTSSPARPTSIVQVQIVRTGTPEVILARSDVVTGIELAARVDSEALDHTAPGDNEYRKLTAATADGGLGLDAVWPSPEPTTWRRRDVLALAAATGALPRQVGRLVQARKLTELVTDLAGSDTVPTRTTAIFYGLLAAGASHRLSTFIVMSRTTWISKLARAADSHTLARAYADEGDIGADVDAIRAILRRDTRVAHRTVVDVLFAAESEDIRQGVEDVIATVPYDTDAFWDEVASNLPPELDPADLIPGARLAYRLVRLARGRVALLEMLLDATADNPIRTASDLASETVATFRARYVTGGLALPGGETDPRALARQHMADVETFYPEHVLADRATPAIPASPTSAEETEDVADAIGRLATAGISFATLDLLAAYQDPEHVLWGELDAGDRADVLARLLVLQRLWRVAPPMLRYETARALETVTDMRPSAFGIQHLGHRKFVLLATPIVATVLGDADAYDDTPDPITAISPASTAASALVKRIFSRASKIHSAAVAVATPASPISTVPTPKPPPAPLPPPPSVPVAIPLAPIGCACQPCATVFGPAAYMYDLLDFLGKHGLDTTFQRFDTTGTAFGTRRDDLYDLDASCDNAMVALPAIDLVNELLEQRVVAAAVKLELEYAPTAGSLDTPSDADVEPLPRRTSGDAALRRVEPEHTENRPIADKFIESQVYPRPLPISLSADEIDALLETEGLARHVLVDALDPRASDSYLTHSVVPGGPYGRATGAERSGAIFKWTPAEQLAVVGSPPQGVAAWYGFDVADTANARWTEALARLDVFLARSGFTAPELYELLSCEHVNPGFAYRVLTAAGESREECDPRWSVITTAATLTVTDVAFAGGNVIVSHTIGSLFTDNGFRPTVSGVTATPAEIGLATPLVAGVPFFLVLQPVSDSANAHLWLTAELAPDQVRLATIRWTGTTFQRDDATFAEATPDEAFYQRALALRIVAKGLGGSLSDADRFLRAILDPETEFSQTTWSTDAHVRLYEAEKLRRRLSLSPREFEALIVGFHRVGIWDGRTSFGDILYEERFVNERVYTPTPGGLRFGYERENIVGGSWAELESAILAGARLTPADLDALKASPSVPWGVDTASPVATSNLSQLYRIRVLSSFADVTAAEWVALADALGPDPFRVSTMLPSPSRDVVAIAAFIDTLGRLASRRVRSADLLYLVEAAGRSQVDRAREVQSAATLLNDLRRMHEATEAALLSTFDGLEVDPFDVPYVPNFDGGGVIALDGLALVVSALFVDRVPTEPHSSASALVERVLGLPPSTGSVTAMLTELREAATALGWEVERPAMLTNWAAVANALDIDPTDYAAAGDTGRPMRAMILWMLGAQWWVRHLYTDAIAYAAVDLPRFQGPAVDALASLLVASHVEDVAARAQEICAAVARPRRLFRLDELTHLEDFPVTPDPTQPSGVSPINDLLSDAGAALEPFREIIRLAHPERSALQKISEMTSAFGAGAMRFVPLSLDPSSGGPGSVDTFADLVDILADDDTPRRQRVRWFTAWLRTQLARGYVSATFEAWVAREPEAISIAAQLPGGVEPLDPRVTSAMFEDWLWLPPISATSAWAELLEAAFTHTTGTPDPTSDARAARHLLRAKKGLLAAWVLGLDTECMRDVHASAGRGHDTPLRVDRLRVPVWMSGSNSYAADAVDEADVATLRVFARTIRGRDVEGALPRSSEEGPGAFALLNLMVTASTPTLANRRDLLAAMGQRLGVGAADLGALLGSISTSNVVERLDGLVWTSLTTWSCDTALDALERLTTLLDAAARFRTPARRLFPFGVPTPNAAVAQAARGAVRPAYTDEQWAATWTPVVDHLRERRRDALVAWLIYHHNPEVLHLASPTDRQRLLEWTSVPDFFGGFLLDPLVNSPVLTSRLVQAHTVVQQYVERVRLGLEPDGLSLSDEAESEWVTWMSRYRVWEAARRVLLYAENWIDPTLLIGPTETYEKLLVATSGSELTSDSADLAVREYVSSLVELGSLEPVSVFREPQDQGSIVHVLARTRAGTRRYYYRTRQPTGTWSGWERVESPIGDRNPVLGVRATDVCILWVDGPQTTSDPGAAAADAGSVAAARSVATLSVARRGAEGWPRETETAPLYATNLFYDPPGPIGTPYSGIRDDARAALLADRVHLTVVPSTDKLAVSAIFDFRTRIDLNRYVWDRDVASWLGMVTVTDTGVAPEVQDAVDPPTTLLSDYRSMHQNRVLVEVRIEYWWGQHFSDMRFTPDSVDGPPVLFHLPFLAGSGGASFAPALFDYDGYVGSLGGGTPLAITEILPPFPWNVVPEHQGDPNMDMSGTTMTLDNGRSVWFGWYPSGTNPLYKDATGRVTHFDPRSAFRNLP